MDEAGALERAVSAIDSNRAAIIATLRELVRVPTINPHYPRPEGMAVTGGEREANDAVLRPVYEAAGCTIDLWDEAPGRANLVGVRSGTGGGRSLIFNGHVDTVSPGDPAAWTSGDPWDGRIEDGQLYGLGATDQKAGLVAQAWAVRALEEAGIRLAGDLILESVVGEEMMEHELGTTATIRRGYRADAAIVSEPTALLGPPTLAPCSGGGTVFALTFTGRAVHSTARGSLIWPGGGGERYGVNAIEKAFFVADGLRKLERDWGLQRRHPLFPGGQFTIGPDTIFGTLHGQSLSWAVANECRLEYLVMYEPERDQADVRSEIESYLDLLYRQDPWLRDHPPSIEWPHTWPPYNTAVDHPICQVVAAAHQRVLGSEVGVQGFTAVDDATYLERGGIPAISYGPGSILACHCFDEHVPVEDVIRACRVYAASAIGWCGLG